MVMLSVAGHQGSSLLEGAGRGERQRRSDQCICAVSETCVLTRRNCAVSWVGPEGTGRGPGQLGELPAVPSTHRIPLPRRRPRQVVSPRSQRALLSCPRPSCGLSSFRAASCQTRARPFSGLGWGCPRHLACAHERTPLSPQCWEAQSWGRAGGSALPASGRQRDLRLLTPGPGAAGWQSRLSPGHSATPCSVAAWPLSAGPCPTRPVSVTS